MVPENTPLVGNQVERGAASRYWTAEGILVEYLDELKSKMIDYPIW